MANVTTYGSPETYGTYIQGVIDGLLSAENKVPDYESHQDNEKEGTPVTLIFNERVPLKAFVNVCQFIKNMKIDEQLWIVPTSNGKIKIQFSE